MHLKHGAHKTHFEFRVVKIIMLYAFNEKKYNSKSYFPF